MTYAIINLKCTLNIIILCLSTSLLNRRKGVCQTTPRLDHFYPGLLYRFIAALFGYSPTYQASMKPSTTACGMTYPTYSAGIGACGKQMQGLDNTFDRFAQRKVHCIASLFMKGGTLNGPNRKRTHRSRGSSSQSRSSWP